MLQHAGPSPPAQLTAPAPAALPAAWCAARSARPSAAAASPPPCAAASRSHAAAEAGWRGEWWGQGDDSCAPHHSGSFWQQRTVFCSCCSLFGQPRPKRGCTALGVAGKPEPPPAPPPAAPPSRSLCRGCCCCNRCSATAVAPIAAAPAAVRHSCRTREACTSGERAAARHCLAGGCSNGAAADGCLVRRPSASSPCGA